MTARPKLWLPFVRRDLYGEGGNQVHQAPLERLRMRLSLVLLYPLRLFLSVGCVVVFFCTCKLAPVVPASVRSDAIAAAGRFWSRACLFLMGFYTVRWVRVGTDGKKLPANSAAAGEAGAAAPVAIVSNHVSWADILVHMSHSFPSFVAKESTQDIPLVGVISQKMQCIYVQRENKDANTQGAASRVKERIQRAAAHPEEKLRPVLLFPEGTTTNGHYLLPFKTGAFLAGVPVQPVVMQYRDTGCVSPAWESIDGLRHLSMVLSEPYNSVTCYELPLYTPSKAEQEDPVLFASNVRAYMLKYSKLEASDARLEDKRAYEATMHAEQGAVKALRTEQIAEKARRAEQSALPAVKAHTL